MANIIYKTVMKAAKILALPIALAMNSCVAEPDDSDLYTFTGQTIEDFLSENEEFSNFNYILQRSGYDRLMATYGAYTCFAPVNDAVTEYIDSLYNDVESVDDYGNLLHNGMTENSLEGLTDSLCQDIAEYHLCNTTYTEVDFSTANLTILTMLGRSITTSYDSLGNTLINSTAAITSADNEVVNGVIHVIDHVIPRSNRLIGNEMLSDGKFTIFYDALERTGLLDVLNGATEKTTDFTYPNTTDGDGYYVQTSYTCKIGYTVFAVPDDVLENVYGITSVQELAEYANTVYQDAANASNGWYDYYIDNNATISTGTDYTDSLNALNMLMRYHILYGGIAPDVLTNFYNVCTNYGNTGNVYDYYETLLPKTLVKAWKIYSTGVTYLNRWVANNTLTDGVETVGSEAMHPVRREGVVVDLDNCLQPLNGYIYPIDSLLVYDKNVPDGVLYERLRVDYLACLPELMSNGYRGILQSEVSAMNNGGDGTRMRFPVDYFDNVVVFNGNNTTIDVNCRAGADNNNFLLYQGDSFQGVGEFDLAIKLPPVPEGDYELRLDITLGGDYFGMMQFYIGDSPEVSSFSPIDIPIDFRMDSDDPRIGFTNPNDATNNPDEYYGDRGIATDQAMRTRNYMRAALSYTKENSPEDPGPARFAAYSVRRIILKQTFKQQDYWLRIKTVLSGSSKYQVDYIEFCPVNIADNSQYLEDMY